jgi:hypothetical protein
MVALALWRFENEKVEGRMVQLQLSLKNYAFIFSMIVREHNKSNGERCRNNPIEALLFPRAVLARTLALETLH